MGEMLDNIIGNLSLTPEGLENFVKIGQEQLDGNNYDLWERIISSAEQNLGHRTICWVSPVSGDLRKVQHWKKIAKTGSEWLLYQEEEIERNMIPPEDTFDFVIPKGYEKREAPNFRLSATGTN